VAKDRANDAKRKPNLDDVRAAYFSGKVTTEEANDLTNSNNFSIKDHPHNTKSSMPSGFALDNEAMYAHKRAGLSEK
jgi:hypothetical protein